MEIYASVICDLYVFPPIAQIRTMGFCAVRYLWRMESYLPCGIHNMMLLGWIRAILRAADIYATCPVSQREKGVGSGRCPAHPTFFRIIPCPSLVAEPDTRRINRGPRKGTCESNKRDTAPCGSRLANSPFRFLPFRPSASSPSPPHSVKKKNSRYECKNPSVTYPFGRGPQVYQANRMLNRRNWGRGYIRRR